jgi:hypothetical protein
MGSAPSLFHPPHGRELVIHSWAASSRLLRFASSCGIRRRQWRPTDTMLPQRTKPLLEDPNSPVIIIGQVLCILPLAAWFAPLPLEPVTKQAFAIVASWSWRGSRVPWTARSPGWWAVFCSGRGARALSRRIQQHRPMTAPRRCVASFLRAIELSVRCWLRNAVQYIATIVTCAQACGHNFIVCTSAHHILVISGDYDAASTLQCVRPTRLAHVLHLLRTACSCSPQTEFAANRKCAP